LQASSASKFLFTFADAEGAGGSIGGGEGGSGSETPEDPDTPENPDGSFTVNKTHEDIANIAGVSIGQTTGIISGKVIALDNIISITCAKGSSTADPCIYTESIRLYQNGATMTVAAKDGYQMSSIVLTIADNSQGDGPITVEGGTASTLSNHQYVITVDEGADEVVITTAGTDKNSRCYVAGVTVTYAATTSTDPDQPEQTEQPDNPEIEDPAADSTLTVEQAIALGAGKANNTYTEGKYYITGVITEIYNPVFGNMRITDEDGNILTIYGTYSADGETRFDDMDTPPAVGDTVTVYGIIGQCNGTSQIKNGWITECVPATPVVPEETTEAPENVETTEAPEATETTEAPVGEDTTEADETNETTESTEMGEQTTEAASETDEPTDTETDEPTATETDEPTDTETDEPTATETDEPTDTETDEPMATETDKPTDTGTENKPGEVTTEEPNASAPATGGGCMSSASGGFAIISVAAVAIFAAMKKKKEDQ